MTTPGQRRYARRAVTAARKAARRRGSEALAAAALLRETEEALQKARAAWKTARDAFVKDVSAMVDRENIWADVVGESPIIYPRLDDECEVLEEMHRLVLQLQERGTKERATGCTGSGALPARRAR